MVHSALIEDNGTENKCSYIDPHTELVTCFNNEYGACLSRAV